VSSDPDLYRLGVQRQEEDCRGFVKRQGWKLAKVYEDNDISAFSGKTRPAYVELLQDIQNGAIQAVVAWHPDRLHRHPKELEHFIDVVEKAHCQVATVQGGEYDLSTASGRMSARIVGAVARGESEHKSERLLRKHEELAKAGKSAGGGRPFGYEADRKTIRPAEAKLIREAARRVLEGESMRSICTDWNSREVPTVGKAGGWVSQVLRRLLISARISGRREIGYAKGKRLDIGKITATAEWPGIISVDDSDHLRHMLSGHRRPGRVREYLLTGGIIRCGVCQQPMQAHPRSLTQKDIAAGLTEGRKEMSCVKRPGTKGCGRVSILAGPVEEMIAKDIVRVVDQGALARALAPGDDRAAIQELLEVQTRQAELRDLFTDGAISAEDWKVAGKKLREKEDKAQRSIENQRRPRGLNGVPDKLTMKTWNGMPLHRRRAFVEVLIESVTIACATPEAQRNARSKGMQIDPSRISVKWKV